MWSFLRPEPHRPLLPKEQIDPTYKRLRVQVFIGIFIGYAGLSCNSWGINIC